MVLIQLLLPTNGAQALTAWRRSPDAARTGGSIQWPDGVSAIPCEGIVDRPRWPH